MATTDTSVSELIINKLTKTQYYNIQNPSDTELYIVPDEVDSAPTSGSDNYVTSGGIYTALQDKANKSEMSVVDGTGNDADKTTITLKTGTSATVLKSHQDISGKQDVINANNKLSADYIQDGTTNKVINVKPDWNAASGADAEILNKPTIPDVTTKADKVSGATSGNFASLDSNGNLADSGHKHSDYLTSHQDISGKADKVSSPTSGNFAALDSNGNLTDSGHKDADYAPSSHSHGTITSGGKIQSSAIAPEDGQSLVVIKVSNSTVQKSTIAFDTSNTSYFLRKDGTWAIPSGGGGLTNYDFTHTANQSVSGFVTVTYADNTRGSRMVSTSADLSVTFAVYNSSDNYLWIKNTGSSDIDILISSVTYNSSSVSNVYMPADGITVPAGKVCEIGIVCNADGAFITSRSDLSL